MRRHSAGEWPEFTRLSCTDVPGPSSVDKSQHCPLEHFLIQNAVWWAIQGTSFSLLLWCRWRRLGSSLRNRLLYALGRSLLQGQLMPNFGRNSTFIMTSVDILKKTTSLRLFQMNPFVLVVGRDGVEWSGQGPPRTPLFPGTLPPPTLAERLPMWLSFLSEMRIVGG